MYKAMLRGMKNRYLKKYIRIALFYTDMFSCCEEFQ